MEALRTSEISVFSNETTWSYIPGGSHLHTRRHENLKSHKRNILCSSSTGCPWQGATGRYRNKERTLLLSQTVATQPTRLQTPVRDFLNAEQ
jgi:hypothetical protein